MQLPLAYLDAAVIEEVPIEAWTDLFEATGWPQSLVSKRDSFEHKHVLAAFEQDSPTDNLLQALETLHILGTEAGREAIVSAMADRRVNMDTLPKGTGEREFALRFFLAQRSDASLADVFARAQIHVQEGSDHRRYNEFMGKEARRIRDLSTKTGELRDEILRYCRESDLGEHVHVQAFEDDATFVFSILRSDRTKKPLAVVRGHTARATIQYRPVYGDLLRYEATIGRLRIAARAASIVQFYKGALGRVLFGDECFFDGAPVCSLRALQDRGRRALEDHGVFGVGRIWMTECLWERGDRNQLLFRSVDCFRSIDELHMSLAEGEFLQAKLKLEVIGKSTRPVTVNIRVPSRIEVSQQIHEHLVERVLTNIGIRNGAPPLSGANLWSLYPWRHPVAVWRTLFGKEMDSMVQAGVLSATRLDSVQHPEQPDAGRTLRAHPVSDGEFYGDSEVDEIPARSLSATDLDGFELVPEKFRVHLRSILGISSGGSSWDGQDLLHLGVVEIAAQRIYLGYALRQPVAGVGDRLRTRAEGAHPVLLLPSSQIEASELARVTLEAVLPGREHTMRAAIHACGIATNVPAIYSAPAGSRLVIDTLRKTVWIDGVQIVGLQPESQPYKFVELMARATAAVAHSDISTSLSAGRQDGTTTARQAKTAAKRVIIETMAAAGRTFDEDPFPSAGNGFYRCTLPAHVQ